MPVVHDVGGGVLRSVQEQVYETGVRAQIDEAVAKKGEGQLEDLVWSGDMWKV